MSREHGAATNHFVCTGEFLRKSLFLQKNFVVVTCRKKKYQIRQNLCDLLRRQKFCCRYRDFHRNSPVHSEAVCPSDVSPQRVAATSRPIGTHGVICRRELSDSVFRP